MAVAIAAFAPLALLPNGSTSAFAVAAGLSASNFPSVPLTGFLLPSTPGSPVLLLVGEVSDALEVFGGKPLPSLVGLLVGAAVVDWTDLDVD